jgi:upstream-binding transcription factor
MTNKRKPRLSKTRNLDEAVASTSSVSMPATPPAMAQRGKGSRPKIPASVVPDQSLLDEEMDGEEETSTVEEPNEEDEEETGTPITWPMNDDRELFKRIKLNIPPNDTSKYNTREKNLNWDSISFNDYTAAECKTRWLVVQKKCRRYRFLAKIVKEAELRIVEPCINFNKGGKKPVPPKQTTAFKLFSDAKFPVFVGEGLSKTKAREMCRKVYKELTDEQKLHSINLALEKEPEFNKEMTQFKIRNPNVNVPTTKLSLLQLERIESCRASSLVMCRISSRPVSTTDST